MPVHYKLAILIDGGFFIKRHKIVNKKPPRIKDVNPFITDIISKVQGITGVNGTDILYRTYYYDCRPYGDKQKRPDGTIVDFAATKIFTANNLFHKDLKTHPQLALRLGELSFDGWKIDPKNPSGPPLPDFKQKSVDMKIGLDIAWMASKRIVDKLVIVTADSDFVSPMKLARKEGILVYLETMGQTQVKMNLREHADFII